VDLDKIYDTLKLFGYRWTLEILTSLAESPKRFNELQRDVGNFNAKTHQEATTRLVKHQLIERFREDDGAKYRLTELGQRSLPALEAFAAALHQWSDADRPRDRSPHP
jgi:DNA-binding HxlR family transcriptional regulator